MEYFLEERTGILQLCTGRKKGPDFFLKRLKEINTRFMVILLTILTAIALPVNVLAQKDNVRFEHLSVEHGLPHDRVWGILEDDKGNLWLSTNKGISKFNPKTGTFTNYDEKDGLQSNEFIGGAYHKGNEQGTSLKIKILPPWWKTWWAYTLYALALAGLGFLTWFTLWQRLIRRNLEQKVLERTHQLTEANKKLQELDRMKTDFLSFASHELRTPLTSVLGFARIIKKRLDQRVFPLVPMEDKKTSKAVEQVASNLDIIVSEGLRLTALINNVLDITKMEEGKIEWKKETVSMVSVLESAREATDGLFANKPLKMIMEVRDPLPDIQGDKDRLVQVFINLISNAVKFTEKGTVTCRARCIGKEICISVSDTGIGIAPEDLPKLFEKFKQVSDTLKTNQKRTGLGLPICKQIVEYHSGEITVESEFFKESQGIKKIC